MFAIGLSLGGPGESSGVAVVEGVKPPDWCSYLDCPPKHLELQVIHNRRFPLGTLKIDQSTHITEILNKTWPSEIHLVVDQTTVSAIDVETIEEQVHKRACRVVIRGLQDGTYSNGVYFISKPTRDPLPNQALESGKLKISGSMDGSSNLVQEFKNFRDRPPSAAALHDDTWREPREDLICAVAIACWKLQQLPAFRYDRI